MSSYTSAYESWLQATTGQWVGSLNREEDKFKKYKTGDTLFFGRSGANSIMIGGEYRKEFRNGMEVTLVLGYTDKVKQQKLELIFTKFKGKKLDGFNRKQFDLIARETGKFLDMGTPTHYIVAGVPEIIYYLNKIESWRDK